MGGGLDLSCAGPGRFGGGRLYRRGQRRRKKRLLVYIVALLAAALALLLPRLPAVTAGVVQLPGRLDTLLAAHFVPEYTARLQALSLENASLRGALAAAVPLRAENAALRALANSPQAEGSRRYSPCTVVGQAPGALTLSGAGLTAQSAVVDTLGRFAGVITDAAAGGREAAAAPAGSTSCRVICTVGPNGAHGSLLREGGVLYLVGLPRHSGAAAGDIAATQSGCPAGLWVGRLAEAPRVEAGGLTARAPLEETAALTTAACFAVSE